MSRHSFSGPFVLLLASAPLLSGCELPGFPGSSSGSSADDEVTSGEGSGESAIERDLDFEAEEGSCNDWKTSYCTAVEECSAFSSHEECQIDVGYVRCHADAPFGACRRKIDEALEDNACEELPEDCSPAMLADRTVPIQECKRIYGAICEFGFFCGTELSIEACMASLQTSTPCENFTAVLPQSEDCVDALSVQACGDEFPQICTGVLRY